MAEESIVIHNDKLAESKFLILFTMLYLTADLASYILVYKLTYIVGLVESAATFIFPLTYLFCDIVAEIYGYRNARRLIWYGLICELFFCFILSYLGRLSSPIFWHNQIIYTFITSHLFRIFLTSVFSTTISEFTNAYAISKWKVLVKGKYFWLRCVGSTLIGELVYTIIAIGMLFVGVVNNNNLLNIVLASYAIKVIYAAIGAIPAAFIVMYLKRVEKINNEDDFSTNFNPFKL